MNFTRKAQKPFVLSLMVGLMFLLTACPGGDGEMEVQPVAADNSYAVEVDADGTFTVDAPGVLGNDTGGSLEAELVTDVAATVGDLNLNSDGSFTFTPAAGFTGTTFTYRATNSAGESEPATVALTADGDGVVDDELTAVDDGPYSATIGGDPLTVPAATGLLANDSVPEDATVAINVNQDDLEEGAVLSVMQDGSFTYTPPADAEEAYTETFTYTLTADEEESEAATVTINVAAPVTELDAVDDTLNADPTVPTTFTNDTLTVNDAIPDGVTPTVTVSTTTTAGGTVVDNGDGTYTYTPPAGAVEGDTDSFTYTLSADGLDDDTATVNVTLADEPEPGVGPYDVNFQNQAAATPDGYIPDYGLPFGTRNGQTYGWVTIQDDMATQQPCDLSGGEGPGNGRERSLDSDVISQLLDTFIHMQGADVLAAAGSFNGVAQNCAWEIAVPNGDYTVSLALGDPFDERNEQTEAATAYQVSVEGVPFPDTAYVPPDTAGDGSIEQFAITQDPGLSVSVTDGRLTILPTGSNTKIAYVEIAAQAAQ